MRHHTALRRHEKDRDAKSGEDKAPEGQPPAGAGGVPDRSPQARDRKSLQLSHQVAETLQEVLAECGDPLLQSLRVLAVQPDPDATRLMVTLGVELMPEERIELGQVHEHLTRASGYLRSEVASAITRKRAPVLVYQLKIDGD